MRVQEIMSSNVITCNDQAQLGEAVRLFWEHDIGFLPVLSAVTGEVRGVITDRDACISAYFESKPLWEIPVSKAMSARVISVRPDEPIDTAQEAMAEAQVHRLPVIEDGKLVGVLSINDIARRSAASVDTELEEEVALTLGAICQPRGAEAVH